MKTNVISIDTGKRCSRCGTYGALANGLCLTCAGEYALRKIRRERSEMKIGEKTIGFLQETISGLIRDHAQDINEAYLRAEGDKLAIGITATIAPGKGNQIKCKVGINFVTDRVKDELEADIDEAQGELFKKE